MNSSFSPDTVRVKLRLNCFTRFECPILTPPPSVVRYTNRPFGHQRECTKRLITSTVYRPLDRQIEEKNGRRLSNILQCDTRHPPTSQWQAPTGSFSSLANYVNTELQFHSCQHKGNIFPPGSKIAFKCPPLEALSVDIVIIHVGPTVSHFNYVVCTSGIVFQISLDNSISLHFNVRV